MELPPTVMGIAAPAVKAIPGLAYKMLGTWYHAPVDHPKSVTLASAQSPAYGLISKAGIAVYLAIFLCLKRFLWHHKYRRV